jgi:quercetin dioxygenase-like cupin family protein/DNA-binding XRE family transcriptional regulator
MVMTLKEPRIRKGKTVSVDQTTRSIGARLRALRKSQRVTLVELAKASGVDAATISRIETGVMTGTLESHFKMATALGVKLTDLYAGIEEARVKDAVAVQPPSARSEVYVHQAGKASITMLTTEVLKKKLMPVLIEIGPGGGTNKEEAKVGTERFLYILEGELEAVIGEQTHRLSRGSTLYFDASLPHSFRNPSRRPTKCLSVVTPPVL